MEVPTVKFNEKSHIRRGKKCRQCGCDHWYKKRPLDCVACAKMSRVRNRDTALAATRAWTVNNPDAVRERSNRYYQEHRNDITVKKAEYRKNTRDAKRESNKRHYKKNSMAHKVRATARKRGYNYDDVSLAEIRALKVRQPLCKYCGKKADTTDHILPLKRGGKHEISNLQRLCRSCNSSKGAKTEEEFQQWRALVANR